MITDPEFHFMANQDILLAGVLFVHRGASRLLARRPRVRLTVVATAAVAAWLGAGLMLVGDNIARHVQQVRPPNWWWRGHGLVAVLILGTEWWITRDPNVPWHPPPEPDPGKGDSGTVATVVIIILTLVITVLVQFFRWFFFGDPWGGSAGPLTR